MMGGSDAQHTALVRAPTNTQGSGGKSQRLLAKWMEQDAPLVSC